MRCTVWIVTLSGSSKPSRLWSVTPGRHECFVMNCTESLREKSSWSRPDQPYNVRWMRYVVYLLSCLICSFARPAKNFWVTMVILKDFACLCTLKE